MIDLMKKMFKYVKSNKKILLTVIAGIIGLILLIIGNQSKDNQPLKNEERELLYTSSEIEDKLENICGEIDGINEIHILVTLESSEENVYAENISINTDKSEYDLFESSDGGGLLKYTIYPKVRGVAVVCTDGDNPKIKSAVINTISASLGLSSAKISVADNGKR